MGDHGAPVEPIRDARRCSWAVHGTAMHEYHDTIWGVPQHDPARLFEFIILEGAQAGLSWQTILNKRAGYRQAFEQFDVEKVASFTDADVARLMLDPSIVRNRAKITSTIGNARAWLQLANPIDFVWAFVDGKPVQNNWTVIDQVPAFTDASDRMSKALKSNGFRFVGTTICYAYMQACGMVNDHVVSCHRHGECAALG